MLNLTCKKHCPPAIRAYYPYSRNPCNLLPSLNGFKPSTLPIVCLASVRMTWHPVFMPQPGQKPKEHSKYTNNAVTD